MTEDEQGRNSPEDEAKAYDIFLRLQMDGDRILAERNSIFLLGSSFLFLGFVTLLDIGATCFLRIVVPCFGILLCVLTGLYNGIAHKGLNFWHDRQKLIEETGGGLLAYMKNKEIQPHVHGPGEKSWLYRKLTYYPVFCIGVPALFGILWAASLVWVTWFY